MLSQKKSNQAFQKKHVPPELSPRKTPRLSHCVSSSPSDHCRSPSLARRFPPHATHINSTAVTPSLLPSVPLVEPVFEGTRGTWTFSRTMSQSDRSVDDGWTDPRVKLGSGADCLNLSSSCAHAERAKVPGFRGSARLSEKEEHRPVLVFFRSSGLKSPAQPSSTFPCTKHQGACKQNYSAGASAWRRKAACVFSDARFLRSVRSALHRRSGSWMGMSLFLSWVFPVLAC